MRTLLAIVSVLAVAAISAGAGQASPQAKVTITAAKSRYGTVLFDGKGRVLYGFTRDRRGKPSRCYGACAAAWPVYYKPGGKLLAAKGVKRKLVGTVRRKNGRLQVTYNGWPLYYYIGDKSPGAISCQNVSEFGGLWLVVSPSGRLVR
jgi:predicted lipoprotein with Yx(FWY)xxD motif